MIGYCKLASVASAVLLTTTGCMAGQPDGNLAQRLDPSRVPRVSPTDSASDRGAPVSASCAQRYAVDAIAERDFAFDGTVTSIGSEPNATGYVRVRFEVHRLWAGERSETRSVWMLPPRGTTSVSALEDSSYDEGSRLLVSGEYDSPRSGPKTALAWSCGFSRLYDEATAATWAAAVGR